ncbi:MAG: lipid A phosphoethanolamine transferase [Flavobacteriaceae bacterium]|jgi:glucan phosphoethanolaminetransferase (alkaline phosphatase superfamily)|nr:lipid A phosphoethanolamine transferase [Flavobacteriaceae bacterium]
MTKKTLTIMLKKIIDNPIFLFWFYLLVNLIPSLYFVVTQPIDILGQAVVILFPMGTYLLYYSIFKNTGMWFVISLPILVLHAFQIVLFYLFGEDVIAADMFLNVATTNSSEIAELLGSLLPSIVLVCVLYIPPLVLAIRSWKKGIHTPWTMRRITLIAALLMQGTALFLSFRAVNKNTETFSFREDVYPVNALNNLGFAANKWDNVKRYPETSKNFSFEATHAKTATNRQIVVLIVGETSRADNWSLYGYNRATNPELSKQENLVVFRDALTQSNTTHKSVSMILSDADATNYNVIYRRKGIIEAFKEAGYKTICLSNQAENSSFIEYFTKEADIYKTIRTTDSKTRVTVNYNDEALIPIMSEMIAEHKEDLFIVIHSYGSHFNYSERYPEDFRKFTPDNLTSVSKKQKDLLVNAYDNSILYTDHFLSSTIDALKKTESSVAMLYTSDHGEDIFDDDRGRFLHASPTPTYYQLRIPMIMWFSDQYTVEHNTRVNAAKQNQIQPVSTNIVFHTLLDAGEVKTRYFEPDLSVVNNNFVGRDRMYLNDHDIAVPYQRMNLKKEDFEMIKKNNIKK